MHGYHHEDGDGAYFSPYDRRLTLDEGRLSEREAHALLKYLSEALGLTTPTPTSPVTASHPAANPRGAQADPRRGPTIPPGSPYNWPDEEGEALPAPFRVHTEQPDTSGGASREV